MAKEDFRIRIRKDGTILFRGQNLTEERARQLREIIEDCLGPVQVVQSDDDGDGGGVFLTNQGETDEARREKLRRDE